MGDDDSYERIREDALNGPEAEKPETEAEAEAEKAAEPEPKADAKRKQMPKPNTQSPKLTFKPMRAMTKPEVKAKL